MQPTTSLGGIAAALALLSGAAQAAVVEYTPTNPVVVPGSVGILALNPLTSQVSQTYTGHVIFCFSSTPGNGAIMEGPTGYETIFMQSNMDVEVERLGGGQVIGESTIGWADFVYIDYEGYIADQPFFVGFAFRNSSEDPYYYGWAEISFASNGDFTFYRSAYEDVAGTDIITPVPEPSSVALLAIGLTGAVLRRRRLSA